MSDESDIPKTRTIPVKTFMDAEQFQRDLAINERDLSGGFHRQAALFAHYARLHADAERQVQRLELSTRIAEAKVAKKARLDSITAGVTKKMTAAEIEAELILQPIVLAFRKAVNEAKHVEALLKAACKAFEQRRDMLVQMGAHERQEREGELRMNLNRDRAQELARALNERERGHGG